MTIVLPFLSRRIADCVQDYRAESMEVAAVRIANRIKEMQHELRDCGFSEGEVHQQTEDFLRALESVLTHATVEE